MQSPADFEALKLEPIIYSPTDIQESTPRHTEPATRLPIGFRTLSIHGETKVSEDERKDGQKRQPAVKG